MGLDPEKEIEAKITPIAKDAIRSALVQGHQTIRGGELPPRNRLRFAWCHVCLETGGGASSWQFNLGNIKTRAGDAWTGLWYKIPPEYLTKAPNEWPYQRGYTSAEQGATDYWRRMFAQWKRAIDEADKGDLPNAAVALSEGKYFEADPILYGQALERWAVEYDKRWPPEMAASSASGASRFGVALLAAAVLGAAAYMESEP